MLGFARRAVWLGLLAAVALAGPARAEIIFGITTATNGGSAGANLVSFNSATPGTFLTNVPLSGITAGEGVLGIDFRPATGQLYAISGSTSVASTGTVYTVNLATGALSTVGTAGNTGLMPGNTSSRVSLDFNPVVDRMRVVTGNRQNYRFNPGTGALVLQDGTLTYDVGDPNTANSGGILAAGIAYTNNNAGATSTTLYAWDYNLDNLATIGSIGGSPTSPNSGTMFSVGNPGGLISNSSNLGMDISGATGVAYLQFDDFGNGGVTTHLGTVNLATGGVTNIGDFAGFMLDISVQPVAVPEPSSMILCGLGIAGMAVRRFRKKA